MRIGTKRELAIAIEILKRAQFQDESLQEAVHTVHTHLDRLMPALDDGAPIFSRIDYDYTPPAADPDAPPPTATILPFVRRRRAQGE